jgi:hypothetical protein
MITGEGSGACSDDHYSCLSRTNTGKTAKFSLLYDAETDGGLCPSNIWAKLNVRRNILFVGRLDTGFVCLTTADLH